MGRFWLKNSSECNNYFNRELKLNNVDIMSEDRA